MMQMQRPIIWCSLPLQPRSKRSLELLAKGGILRKICRPAKISGLISTRYEASSDGIVTLPLCCWPMPSSLVFACTTRVILRAVLQESKLNPHSLFCLSPLLRSVTSWPDSSFSCPLVPSSSRLGHCGEGNTSIGLASIIPDLASKQDSCLLSVKSQR